MHRARELPIFEPGDEVWVKDQSKQGEILSHTQQPRSYLVKTDKGILRRNRTALVSITKGSQERKPQTQPVNEVTPVQQLSPELEPSIQQPLGSTSTPDDEPTQYTTRSGRVVRPPQRLDLWWTRSRTLN